MTFLEFINEHPVAVAVGLVLTSASITAAALTFLWRRHIELRKMSHSAEINRIKTQLCSRIQSLKNNLNSIDRRVDGVQEFFDIKNIAVSRLELSALDENYESFEDGRFFVFRQISEGWTYEMTTEARLLSERFGENFRDFEDMLSHIITQLREHNVHRWRHAEETNVELIFREGESTLHGSDPVKLKFCPNIRVSLKSYDDVKDLEQAAAIDQAKLETSRSEARRLLEHMERYIQDGTEQDEAIEPIRSDTQGLLSRTGHVGERAFDDITGFVLMAILADGYKLAIACRNVQMRILSSQKKGNVLYLKIQIIFTESIENSKSRKRIIIDQEHFVIGTTNEFLHLISEVPSKDGIHDAFSWINAWLASFRVLMDR